MSLLFDHGYPVKTPVTFKRVDDYDGRERAIVAEELWKQLGLIMGGEPSPALFALSMTPERRLASSNLRSNPKSFICRPNISSHCTGLVVPEQWQQEYSHIFPTSSKSISNSVTYKVTLVRPVILTEVILLALSRESFETACASNSILERLFCEDHAILRRGAVVSPKVALPSRTNGHVLPEKNTVAHYQIMSTEPVLQGYAKEGVTKFYVVQGEVSEEHVSDSVMNEDIPDIPDDRSEFGFDEDTESGIEINESFLASSVLSSVPAGSVHGAESNIVAANGLATHLTHETTRTSPANSEFLAEPLSRAVDNDPSADDCSLLVRTADLGKIGAFNGDWVIASARNTTNYRLVRVRADDDIVKAPRRATASPLLLRNLAPDNLPTVPIELCLRPSPFGSRIPSIPTARSVTVARVASPISMDRSYQPLFLRALKVYFDGTKRLAKKGDLIGVTITTDDLHKLPNPEENVDTMDEDTCDVLFDEDLPLSSTSPDAVVFFVITNLEHDIVADHFDPSAADMYAGSTMGELGCWIDSPSITKMVQTGVEHSLVPDMMTYLSIDTRQAKLPALSGGVDPPSRLADNVSPFVKLYDLSLASLGPLAVGYDLHLSVLLKGARGTGKFSAAVWVARRLGMHLLEINCFDVIGENDVKTEGILRARFEKAVSCSPCMLVLRHVDALAQTSQVLESGKEPAITGALRDCLVDLQRGWKESGYPVVVVATTADEERVPLAVLSSFKHEMSFEAPSESERLEILEALLEDTLLGADVSLTTIATKTAALVAADLVDLVDRAKLASLARVINATSLHEGSEASATYAGLAVTASDLESALSKARASYSESIGAPKIPNVSWDDVGGLADVKSDILDTIQLPLEHPELFAEGLKKRSGILLYGPPGTGKTLLAKAVATSCSLNFFSVKGPELLNMYIGESEANVRRVFQRARDAKPCVIFFDELDSVAPKRGNHGDSGGVMDRIVSQLLVELDGMADSKGGEDVFVIGATNRPDLLDPALLRPGRFDRMLYLGVSDTHIAQRNILEALTRRFQLSLDVDLQALAELCPFNYTGADFYALCSDAMLKAMSRIAQEIDTKIGILNNLPPPHQHPHPLTPQYYLAEMATSAETDVIVSQRDFQDALRDLIPSVSKSEMTHYLEIRRAFSSETINNGMKKANESQSLIHGKSFNEEFIVPMTKFDKGKGKAE